MDVSQRTVLLTGATGGIGHAIARELHRRGATLILTGRRESELEALAAETGGRALACDLSIPEEVDRLVDEAGEVDVLVNNAALPADGPLLEYEIDQIDRALAVNLRAPIVLSRLLGARMVERRAGHIVFVSSLAGKAASPSSSLYSATKFGLRGFGLGLREDLRPAGVGVSTVFPGFIRDAGMFAATGAELPRGVGTRTPEDVAAGVARAIERDLAEVDVAPAALRLGAKFASVAPELAARFSRMTGSDKIATDISDGHRHQR
jgi:short-subunit dehydrogenase